MFDRWSILWLRYEVRQVPSLKTIESAWVRKLDKILSLLQLDIRRRCFTSQTVQWTNQLYLKEDELEQGKIHFLSNLETFFKAEDNIWRGFC